MSKKRQKPDYLQIREQEQIRLELVFENMASTLFLWEGLPPGLRSGWIERKLYTLGQLVFFKADFQTEQTGGFMMLPLARDGELNVYSVPVHYAAISPLKTFYRDFSNAILVRNNELRVPTRNLIAPLIGELADIKTTMRVNRNAACKTPVIIRTTEEQRLTAMNTFVEISENKPLILADKMNDGSRVGYDASGIPPYWGKELREEYENVRAEILTILGVINNPVTKAERVNTIEATSNRGELVDNIDAMLTYRKIACDEINEMFGAQMAELGFGPISVKMNNNYTQDMLEQGLDPQDGMTDNDQGGDEE